MDSVTARAYDARMRREYTCSQTAVFRWVPPDGVSYASAATLTVALAAGSVGGAMTRRAADTIAAVSADRRRLTLTWGTDGALVMDETQPGLSAYIDDGAEGQVPVRILRMVSDSGLAGVVELADALPHDIGTGGAFAVLLWQRSFSAPASPETCAWSVQWSRRMGGGTAETVVDSGVAYIVRALWETGLAHAGLCEVSPFLAVELPPGQASWAPQIAIALDHVRADVQRRLPSGVDVGQTRGAQFRRAHSLAAQLLILRAMQAGGRDRAQAIEQTQAEYVAELDGIFAGGLDWIDADGDGVLDAAESTRTASRVTLRAFTASTRHQDATESDAVARTPMVRMRVEDVR